MLFKDLYLLVKFTTVFLVTFAATFPNLVNAISLKSELHDYRIVELASGLENPWSMAFLSGEAMLITERTGRLRLFKNKKLDPTPLGGVPDVVASGQGGLFDVLLHPKFDSNRQIYLSYAAKGKTGVNTRVTRFVFDPETSALRKPLTVFDAKPKVFGGRHFGGRMIFDRLGYLFISTGDRGEMLRAQALNDHSGSIIRIRDDGRIPKSNPVNKHAGIRTEIFSYGHRNPQGMALNPLSGAVWTHEHGPRGGDEINIINIGKNYGWPMITHGVDYDGSKIGLGTRAPGMEQPQYYWTPSIAPSGMVFYSGTKFPRWKNNLFIGSLKNKMLVRLEITGNVISKEERLLKDKIGRVRDVREGPDGFIYLITDELDGRLVRLEPNN